MQDRSSCCLISRVCPERRRHKCRAGRLLFLVRRKTCGHQPCQKSESGLLVWVADSAKSPLPQARLRVKAGGREIEAWRSDEGYFEIPETQAKAVVLQAEADGFIP